MYIARSFKVLMPAINGDRTTFTPDKIMHVFTLNNSLTYTAFSPIADYLSTHFINLFQSPHVDYTNYRQLNLPQSVLPYTSSHTVTRTKAHIVLLLFF